MNRLRAALLVNLIAIPARAQAPDSACAAPTLVAPDTVSTAATEVRLAISDDGRVMLWGVIGRDGGAGGWEIWERRLGTDGWTEPRPASFNSAQNEFDPALSPGGEVYFFSNRPGGAGGDDLYVASPDGDGWGAARSLGPAINTAGNEWAPVISPDGRLLMFSSDGRGGAGGQDLWLADRVGDGWGNVRPVSGVNSAEDDFDAAFLPDGRIVFTRGDADAGRMALYVSDGSGEARRLGAHVNPDGVPSFGPSVSAAEPGMLVYSSHHPGNVRGRIDLYRVGICAIR